MSLSSGLAAVSGYVAGMRNLRSGRATPEQLRLAINTYPPLLFAGVKVDAIAPDWSAVDVHLKLHPLTRNYMGTQYGGSLYTMCDPWWALLLIHRLGPGYDVWDRKAEITFVSPGRSRVFGRFEISEADVADVRRVADAGEKALPWYETTLTGADGRTIVRVRKQIYARAR